MLRFPTTPGIRYTVESSNNLTDWTVEEEHYGIGHEYVVTLREFTPPPPVPPGSPPPVSVPRAVSVSLRMQPASGPAGGTVVSWASHDHGGPVVVRIAGEMVSAWNQLPFFWDRYGGHYFFIWHPNTSLSTPLEIPPLGPLDTALLAQLEASLPAMNQQVTDSIVRARIAPTPAPPDPGSKRFLRVKVDSGTDTDSDGSPDWAEFQIAARAAAALLVSGPAPAAPAAPPATGDPFNPDTNNDGIPDGQQLDTDRDGTYDAVDPDISDNTATYPLGPEPRYALFPITNAVPLTYGKAPLQINDKGTVLYPDGTWAGGVWSDLVRDTVALKNGLAVTLNDHGVILGSGEFQDPLNAEPFPVIRCYWSAPDGTPTVVSKGEGTAAIYAFPRHPQKDLAARTGMVLSNQGAFFAPTYGWKEGRVAWLRPGLWTLPAGNLPVNEATTDGGLFWGAGSPIVSGVEVDVLPSGFESWKSPHQGIVMAPHRLPDLPFIPINVVRTGEVIVAMPHRDSGISAKAFVDGAWKDSPAYGPVLDMSTMGAAIGRSHDGLTAPIYLNGKWKDIARVAPGLPAAWKDSSVRLLDTTPGGWILAQRGPLTTDEMETAVLLPIKLDSVDNTVTPANQEDPNGGVDRVSMTAHSGPGRVPEIWIMAPSGENKAVRFRSPLNTASKLNLPSNLSIQFTPETIQTHDEIVQIKALANTGSFTPSLKLGGLAAINAPLQIKVMKKRNLKIAIHPVALKRAGGVAQYPSRIPSNAIADRNDFDQKLTEYLDKVYGRQVNLHFDIDVMSAIEVDFDTVAPVGVTAISAGNTFTPEMEIACTNPQWPANADIDVWILGGTKLIGGTQQLRGSVIGGTLGEDSVQRTPYAIIDGNDSVGRVIAHEIGHIFIGTGHPDVPQQNHFARLVGTSQEDRLMNHQDRAHDKCQFVKKEWDEIEKWLKLNLDINE